MEYNNYRSADIHKNTSTYTNTHTSTQSQSQTHTTNKYTAKKTDLHTTGTHALRNTLAYMYTCTFITHRYCYAVQQKHAHACVFRLNIFIHFEGYSAHSIQPYLCKACYPKEYSLPSRSEEEKNTLRPAGKRCHMVDKVWPIQTCSKARWESRLSSILYI